MTSVSIRNPARGVHIAIWESLGADKCGDSASVPVETFMRSVQICGKFEGAKASFEGSNDGENWSPLFDATDKASIHNIEQVTRFLRGRTTGGNKETAVKFILMTV